MAFPKGKKNPNGGRKKGIPNKRSWDCVRALEREGFDPAAKLVQLTLDAEADYRENRNNDLGPGYLGIAVNGCSKLMRFVYPERKAVDVTTQGEKIHTSFTEMVAAVLADAAKSK